MDRVIPASYRHLLNKLSYYAAYGFRFVVLRRTDPLIYGIALTDRCNLSCEGCRIPELGRPDMSWAEIVAAMKDARERGFREIYFSGGEPMLWRDGERTLEDAIAEARRTGFFHIHVYTNGTLGLDTSADLVWVSMDGLPGTFEKRRGDYFEQVEKNIRSEQHPKVAVIYVIDQNTEKGIEAFLEWVRDTRLPVIGVMFYFHTPYYGRDALFLDADERAPVIDRLIGCIKNRLPVINSRAGLRALKTGNWPRRMPIAYVRDVDGESACCRAEDDICDDCGYAACTELTELRRLRLSAVLGMLRYW